MSLEDAREFDFLADREDDQILTGSRAKRIIQKPQPKRTLTPIPIVGALIDKITAHPAVTKVVHGSRQAFCTRHNIKIDQDPNGLLVIVTTRFTKHSLTVHTTDPVEVDLYISQVWRDQHK